MITIDMEKAKDIHRNLIRQARKDAFSKLDVEFQIALEKGDSELQKEIATKKQELRDLTDSDDIKNAKTTSDLIKSWPDILGTKPLNT